MKKKKRNEDVPSFVDIEADEDSSLDFEMEDESEDIDGLQEEEIEVKPRKNWHKFTEELANRYNAEEEEEESSEPSQLEEVTYTPQYMFMPDNKSPRLWIIRCVRNKEKDVAFKILNNVMQNEKDKLNATSDFNYFANDICSVVVKPDLFGYIYVESFSRQAVLDALYNIRLVNRQRISPVPLSEMVDVLTLKGMTDVRQGSFARIRKGKYRNDVCQIIEVISTEMVRVRIVPRLTNIPKLFNISDMDDKEVQTKTIDGKKVYIYKRETFIDGFLEKEVISSNLIFNSDISFEESKVFEKKKKYSLGEKIRVTRGDYTNTKGIIRNIERNEVEIEINNEMLRIDINDIEKNYCEGDTISYNGRNAMIVKIVDDDIRFIYTDTFGEEGQSKVDMIEPQIFDKGFEIIKNPNMNRIRRDPYLNMQVDIKKGDYKGFVGVVKDVYKDSCRVLLESNMKYINVDREHLVLKDYNAKRISPFDAMKQETSYEQFGKTPNVYQDFGMTPTHRSDFGKTPSYKSFGRTPSHRSDFGKTPNYKQDFGKTPNYKQDYGKTPNYKQDFGRTPNYKQDFGKTPNYKQDYGKTPNYQNSFTPGHRSDTAKTSHYEKGLQNKDREKGQNTSWLRDNTINNVLVIVDGEERVLKEIRNDKYILDDNRECKNISYVMPGRYDKVCVMEGSEKGMYGILIELENNMGVVRCDNNEVRSVDLKSLSKLNNSVLR